MKKYKLTENDIRYILARHLIGEREIIQSLYNVVGLEFTSKEEIKEAVISSIVADDAKMKMNPSLLNDIANRSEKSLSADSVICIVCIFITLIISIYTYYIISIAWPARMLDDLSKIGDSCNIITALFTALALFGVMVTIIFQRRDFVLQKYQINLNKIELQRQRRQYDEQQDRINMQDYENILFSMIRTYHEFIGSITIGEKDKGKECFINKIWPEIKVVRELKGNIREVFERYDYIMTPYIGILKTLLSYIMEAKNKNIDISLYRELLYIQFINEELYILNSFMEENIDSDMSSVIKNSNITKRIYSIIH
jgi:hypothetical protein